MVKAVSSKRIIIVILAVISLLSSAHPNPSFGSETQHTLNPIPYSPPLQINSSITPNTKLSVSNNLTIKEYIDGTRLITPAKLISTTVNSRLDLFASVVSFAEAGGISNKIDNSFRVGSSYQSQSNKYSLLMYPQIKDVIPPTALINSAKIVTSYQSSSAPSNITIDIYNITSSWDPRTVSGSSLPTFGPQVNTNTWNLQICEESSRIIDVTQTVTSWFNGSSEQWGFKISTPIAEGVEVDVATPNPPRLYIDYELPTNAYTGNLPGGTWYDDGICPGLWLPQRATYFKKTGILNNEVKTRVFFDARDVYPPFGYSNQSFRFKVGGYKINQSNSGIMALQIINWSSSSFDTLGVPQRDKPPIPGPVCGDTVQFDESAIPPTEPECIPEKDEDDEMYIYTPYGKQRLLIDNDDEWEKIDPFDPEWYDIWSRLGRRFRVGPHGNLTSTVWRKENQIRVINIAPTCEAIPDLAPPDGVMDESLPQPEFEQLKDIGNNGSSLDKSERDFSGSQANWWDQGYKINPLNAGFELKGNDFEIAVHGDLMLSFGRTYSSVNESVFGTLGPGWHTNIDQHVEYWPEGYIHYVSASGQIYTFSPRRDENGSIVSYDPPPQLDWKVYIIGEGSSSHIEISDKVDDKRLIFSSDGRLQKITTKQGGEIVFNRNSSGRVTSISDSYSGRQLVFTYDSSNRLTSVQGPCLRNYTFAYNASGDLTTVTDPEGYEWKYEYTSHRVTKVTDPRNNSIDVVMNTQSPTQVLAVKPSDCPTCEGETVAYSVSELKCTVSKPTGEEMIVQYNEFGTKDSQTDSLGGDVDFHCDLDHPTDIKSIFNQLGEVIMRVQYDDKRRSVLVKDALNNASTYTYNDYGKISSYTDKEDNTYHYDWLVDGSMLVRVVDPLGREVLFTYDGYKNLVSITNPYKDNNRAITAFEYDSNGYTKKVIDPEGKITEFEHNDCGEVTKVRNAYGDEWTYTYNKLGKVTKVTGPSPDSYEHRFLYDGCMNLTQYTNPRGYSYAYEYNALNKKIKITAPLGGFRSYVYDESGKMLKVIDNHGNERSSEYDPAGKVIKTINELGKSSNITYDLAGRVIKWEGPVDDYVQFSYNILGQITSSVTALGATHTFTYDKEGVLLSETDPEDRTTSYTYDACYHITKVRDAHDNESTFEYWPSGALKKFTNPLLQIIEYDFNKVGNTISKKDNEGNTISYEYDDLHRLIKTTNPLGKTSQAEYNKYNLPKKVINELGKYCTFEYDANLNLTKEITALGKQWRWTYNEEDKPLKRISPLGNEVLFAYDDVCNVKTVTDPLGHYSEYTYTENYNVNTAIDAVRNTTSYVYDDSDRLIKQTKPKGNYQEYTYDQDHNLTSVKDPTAYVSTYLYDDSGALTERRNPRIGGGYISSTYGYDELGRRIFFTDEVGKRTATTYNELGLVTNILHPNGKDISSTYDSLSRLTGVTFGDGTSYSFVYDTLYRNSSWTDEHGTQSYSFDDASRVTSVSDPFDDQISYTYDDDNRLISTIDTLGTTTMSYDDENKPTQITLTDNSVMTNNYDSAGRTTSINLPINVDISYTYDNANKPTHISYDTNQPLTSGNMFRDFSDIAQSLANGKTREQFDKQVKAILGSRLLIFSSLNKPSRPLTTITSFSYTYDANSNPTQRTYPDGTHNLTYDNYDRLTEAQMPWGTYTYTYDVRSNRSTMRFVNNDSSVDQTSSYSYVDDDRLTTYTVVNNLNQQTIKTVNYTYDDAGNILTKQVIENGNTQTTTYTYFDDNRIKTVTLPSEIVVSFTYHADGSRATKTNATEWITYHYNGDSLIKEVHHNKDNHTIILFTIYYQAGRIIIDPGSQGGGDQITYYNVSDGIGTTYKLLDSNSNVVADYSFGPFGERQYTSNPSIYYPIVYAGLYWDSEIELYFANSRYYDPIVGRFTTKDSYRGELNSPISQNRYIYCHQDPIRYSDPSGFSPTETDCTANSSIRKVKTPQKPLKPAFQIGGG